MELPKVWWRKAKGRWVLPYKARDGKWAQKLCPAEFGYSMKAQARAWAASWLSETTVRQLEPLRRGDGLTIRAASSKWLELVKRETLAPSTIANYRSDFNAHILNDAGLEADEQLADRAVADVGTDYARLKAWFLAIRRRCTSASRARSVFSTMRVFFDEAIVQRWFRGANPFHNKALVKLLPALPTKREKPPIVVPLEHAQALIGSDAVPAPWRVRYALAFTSGDRDGELSGLSWASVLLDQDVPVMEIDRARRLVRARDEERGPLKTTTSPRTMPLHPAAIAALRWWKDSPDGVAFYLGRAPTPLDPVFPSERNGATGAFARPRSARRIREHLGELELPTVGAKGRAIDMHSCRRSFLTFLERAGVSEKDRKALAGHGIADVTHRHYTAEDAARLRELAGAVARIALRWEDPAPLSGGVVPVVPTSVPGVVPPGTKPPRGAPTLPIVPGTLTGAPGKNRTCDQRFRKSLELCAEDDASAATSRADRPRRQPVVGSNDAIGCGVEPDARIGTKAGTASRSPALERAARGLAAERATWAALDEWSAAAAGVVKARPRDAAAAKPRRRSGGSR